MGMERLMASAKLSQRNAEFLDDWARQLRPYEISQSSLIDRAVDIVRTLVRSGKLKLDPESMQALVGTESSESLRVVPKRER